MRVVKLKRDNLQFHDNQIEGFIFKKITRFGNGAKVDVPKKYTGRTAYVLIPREK